MDGERRDRSSSTVLDALAYRAALGPDRTAFEFFGGEGSVARLTFAELADAVASMGTRLAQLAPPGGRAVILYPPGLDYIVALCAAMSAGVAAVPAYPPTSPRHVPRLQSLLENCRADIVLADEHFAELEGQLGGTGTGRPGSGVPWVLGTTGSPVTGVKPTPGPDDVALIQYTSGSTSAPRGVVLTHRAMASNLVMIEAAVNLTPDDRAVLWLPPYHDMGLIGGILAPLWVGYSSRLMSPLSFVRDPLSWLDQISELGATVAGGPNFGFDRCSRHLARVQRRSFDLSSWRVAFTGAEPVRAASLARFAAAFAPYGFREQAFYPCYGLAEATLMATGGARGEGAVVRVFSRKGLNDGEAREPEGPRDSREMVSSGRAVPGLSLRISDEAGRSLPERSVGEIRLSGPNLASGYLDEAGCSSGTSFVEDEGRPELATRDLGFLDGDGELFVCGRASDMIIVRGRNVHPEDVELVAEEALPQPGPAIAFGIDIDGEERIAVLREVRDLDSGRHAAATARIRSRLGEVLGLQPAAVVLVKSGDLPRTSSGKVQRGEARRRYLLGHFDSPTPVIVTTVGVTPVAVTMDSPHTGDAVLALQDSVARVLDLPPAAVVVTEPATALGLDSLGAVVVSEDVAERHGLAISPAELVGGSTLEAVAGRAVPARPEHAERGDDAATEASYGERAMWLHERLGEGASPYVLPVALELEGEVDRNALEGALADVVSRLQSFRTTWTIEQGVLLRRVVPRADPELRVERCARLGKAQLRAALDALGRCRLRPELPGGTLRATLLEVGEARRVLHLAVHHLAADHWALQLLVADLARCYEARLAGTPPPPSGATGMADTVLEERARLASPEGARTLASWVESLQGAPAPSRLPGSRTRAQPLRFDAGVVPVTLRPRTYEMLRSLARSEATTPFVVLAAAVHALLARVTGQHDVVIGAPTSRRGSKSRRGVVGLLMNTMPLRLAMDGSWSFRQVVRAEHAVVTAARAREDMPFVRIVEALGLGGESSPLSTASLTMLDRTMGREVPGTRWHVIELPQQGVAVDVALDVRESDGTMAIDLRYAEQALAAGDAERFALRFSLLLEHAVAVPDRVISAIPLAHAGERARLLALGAPEVALPPPEDVFARFAEHATRMPDAVSVRTPEETLTYAMLYREACALASELREARANVVAVRLPRGPSLLVAMLASLAAEVPWVPIDPKTPVARLANMLAQVNAHLLITEEAPPGIGERLRVMPPHASGRTVLDPSPADSRGLAYVMFTSGSSGRPKGVMVERRSLSAVLDAVARLEPVAPRRRMLALTNVGFDISVLEMLLPLVMGATVVVAGPEGVRAPDTLLELIAAEGVDLLQSTPSTLSVLLDAGMRLDGVTVLCGGEPAPPGLFRRIRRAGADAALNVYGPTETAIWSTARRADGDGDPPLGRPLAGESVYVLDGRSDVAPTGIEGELCIGGIGVARGYAGQPGLTAERFVPDPYAAEPGARMYRTGDLARYDGENELRFCGRRDRQVKIRGARVECAEVELALQEHGAIRRAAVVAVEEPAGPALLAAVQWQATERVSVGELRAFLGERLPSQAVPSLFREVGEIPVTDRGKLDVRALTRASPLDEGHAPSEAPVTPSEAALAEIWRALLGVERVRRFDDFFMLGGHSLHAVAVVTQVAQRLDRRITVADVMQVPTLAHLAARVDRAERVNRPANATASTSGTLGDAQRRLWAFDQLHPGTATANISLAVRLEGPLDVAALQGAVNAVIERHAELRATFPSDIRGRPVRRLRPHRSIDLEVVTVPAQEGLARIHQEILRPFDTEHGPLTRVSLLRTGPDDHLLAFTAHHLVVDATAAGVLVHEMSLFYRALASGSDSPRLGRATDYAELVARLSAERDPAREAADLAWWGEVLAGAPRRVFAPGAPGGAARVEADTLGEVCVSALRSYAKSRGVTPFMVVVAALARVLAERTKQREVVIGTDVSGRDEPGAAEAVGPLVNQVCLRIDTAAGPTPAGLVEHVRSRVTDALAHARVSYDHVVAALAPDPACRALFDVKLAYQPAVEDHLDLGELRHTRLPRAPVAPLEVLLVFVRERPHELGVELQYRDGDVDGVAARHLLAMFLKSLEALVTTQDFFEPPAAPSRSATRFTRRAARTVETPVPGRVGEPDTDDRSAPPVVRAASGTDLRIWLGEHPQRVADWLALHGALLFRGFGVREPDALHELVRAAGEPAYISTEHDRARLGTEVFTPIPYSHRQRLLWHNEDTFRPEWPARLWFACARPADHGGETTVADTRTALSALGDTGRRLESEGVMYVRRFSEGLGRSWQDVFGTSDRAQVEARCREQGIVASWEGERLVTRTVLPAVYRYPPTGEECFIAQLLHFHPAALSDAARSSLTALYGGEALPRDCRHANGTPIPDPAVRALIEACESTERVCRWQAGDVMLIDNALMSHGRRPYSGERRLYVAMTGSIDHRPL